MNDVAGVPSVIPVLAVEDVQEATGFYSHLGFREVFSIPDRSGKLVHAHLRKGDSALFLGRLDVSHYRGHRRAEIIRGSRSIERGIGITLILQVNNLASVYDFVCREKLEVLAEPVDEYYGDRVFFFLDPFGYEWKISQPTSANPTSPTVSDSA
jgi:uncharacterized glyoxalase superfamily protein PhnB